MPATTLLTIQVPAYDPAQHLPPPPPLPTATLTPKGVLYLSKAFAAALALKPGQPIDLVPPMPGSAYWHLDLRPTAGKRVDWSGVLAAKGRGQGARVKGLRLAAGQISHNLTLCLLPGEPTYPAFYPLLPSAYFAPHQTPPLAA